jgi:hypothetical protein
MAIQVQASPQSSQDVTPLIEVWSIEGKANAVKVGLSLLGDKEGGIYHLKSMDYSPE